MRGRALGAPRARAPAAILPPRGGLGGGKEGAGLAARDLEGRPAARTARPRPGRCPASGAPFPAWQGDAPRGGAQGGSGGAGSCVQLPPAAPSRPPRPPQGSPEGRPGAGLQARHGGRSRQAPPQQHSRRHLAPAASLLGRGLRPRPLAGSAARACAARDPLTAPQLRGDPSPALGEPSRV